MTGEGGRSAHLARILLLIALVTINATLITLHLDKHRLLWFQSSADDDSGPSGPAGPSPTADSVDGSQTAEGDEAVSLDVGDPFRGRGGVPNGPPEPRKVLLRSDGTVAIVGSAPSGAVAADVAEVVADQLSVEAGSVDQSLTWHPAASSQSTGGAVTLDPPMVYESGQVAVPPDATADLDFAAAVLGERPEAFVVVTGNVDDLGDSDENLAVAAARVSAVVGYLESQGVDRSRVVSAVAPINPEAPPNRTEDERAFNRRVEVRFENLLGAPASPPGSVAAADPGDPVDVLWSIDSALVAGFDCAGSVEGEPLRIGYAADLSPDGASADVPGPEAAEHLALLINCSGGVRGRPVEVAVFDIGGGPLAARQAIGELLAWEPMAVIGPRFAGSGIRLVAALAGRVPVVFAGSTDPAAADASRASFLVASDGGSLAEAAARFAIDNGWRSAVTFASPGPDYGFEPTAFAGSLATGGGAVVAETELPGGSSADKARANLAEAMTGLASGPIPDVILVSMPTEHLVALRQEAAAAGFDTNWITTNSLALAGPAVAIDGDGVSGLVDLDGLYLVGNVPSVGTDRAAQFDRSFEAATGLASTDPTAAALAVDAMAVIIEAYLQAGGGDNGPEAVARALSAGLVVDGVGGPIRYTGSGNPTRTIHIQQIVGGEPSPITSYDP